MQPVDPPCGKVRLDDRETLGERLHVRVETHEDEPVPGLDSIRGQAVRRLVDGFARRERHRVQLPGVRVRPAVVRTLDAPGVGRSLDEQGAPVGTEIRKRRELPVLLSHEEHRLPANDHRKLVAARRKRVLGGDEYPVPVPDPGHLGGNQVRVAIGGVGEGVRRIERKGDGAHDGKCSERGAGPNGRGGTAHATRRETRGQGVPDSIPGNVAPVPSVRDAEEQREGSVDGQHVGVVEASEDIAEPARAGREGLVDHHGGSRSRWAWRGFPARWLSLPWKSWLS